MGAHRHDVVAPLKHRVTNISLLKMKEPVKKKSTLFGLLKPYSGLVSVLLILALLSNGLNLLIPKLIQKGIDDYTAGAYNLTQIIIWFAGASAIIFILTYLQTIFQSFISEKVVRDLRFRLSYKISEQNFTYISEHTSSRLLTNITSDADAVKMFISQSIVSIISSGVLIVGAAILLININVRLGLIVLIMVPVIGGAFFLVFKKVRGLFKKTQEVMDWLNKVINESILGAALIRVLNAQFTEANKFISASGEARNLGLSIVNLFSMLIPVVVLTASLAQLAVLGIGGHFIILDEMTLGEFAAFNSYIAILIFPILIIGFTSSVIARASASHQRIQHILDEDVRTEKGTIDRAITGGVSVKNVSLTYGDQKVLQNISFDVAAKSRTAIIGPTSAGKTQLLNLIIGLLHPSAGEILFDDIPGHDYKQDVLLKQIGIVFQDSIIFNLTLRENIAFNKSVTDDELKKAIETAELKNFISSLPEQLNTVVSERGSSLSGGQKQRLMLARALAIDPTLLLLDDFTARVDNMTEEAISQNLKKNYPDITLISVTQKIEPVKDFDQIILLMEGEIISRGTHDELMSSCPEYVQIYKSQQSTTDVEAAN